VNEKKYVAPDGMLDAAWKAALSHVGATERNLGSPRVKAEIIESWRVGIEAALCWQSENPIVPTPTDVLLLADELVRAGTDRNSQVMRVCAAWQRRMYLAPEPEVPEEIKDLVERWGKPGEGGLNAPQAELIEAYRRGWGAREAVK